MLNATTSTYTVVIDVSSCKGAAVSWVCCRDAGCTVDACGGGGATKEAATDKCNEATSANYTVPYTATSINLQLHDGANAGNVVCSGSPSKTGAGTCCGGAGGGCDAPLHVSAYTIALSSCPDIRGPPVSNPPECQVDADCAGRTALNAGCGTAACNTTSGNCYSNPAPKAGNTCRASAGTCCRCCWELLLPGTGHALGVF